MVSRVATAAATASVVPFHCVICFEEFNLTERYPVVLPCGHTYVCNVCAKRLKRCMECRESLFYTSPTPKVPPLNPRAQPYYYRGRVQAGGSPQPHHPPHQDRPEPVALPLPKNLVLIAMMEAAERQSDVPIPEQTDISTSDDEEEFDLNRIISGMATLAGPCGTYAVREPLGLTVLPFHPLQRSQGDEVEEKEEKEEGSINLTTEEDDVKTSKEPFNIVQGQTVQVVDFRAGVATLARGSGYIVANSAQLVKVGGPLETCCRLEGMVDTLSLRGKDLELALDENMQIERSLKKEIDRERRRQPNYPVITDPPERDYIKTPSDRSDASPQALKCRGDSEPMLQLPGSPNELIVAESKGARGMELVGENQVLVYSADGRCPSSPNSIDNSEINQLHHSGMHYRRNSEDDLNAFAYGCGSALFGKNFLGFGGAENRIGLSFDSLEDGTPSRLTNAVVNAATAATSVHRREGATLASQVAHAFIPSTPMLSNSFDTVDFRTGLSGHRGLSKTSPRSMPVTRSSIRMMGDHRGIGMIRSHYGNPRTGRSNSHSPAFGPRFASPQDYHFNHAQNKINT